MASMVSNNNSGGPPLPGANPEQVLECASVASGGGDEPTVQSRAEPKHRTQWGEGSWGCDERDPTPRLPCVHRNAPSNTGIRMHPRFIRTERPRIHRAALTNDFTPSIAACTEPLGPSPVRCPRRHAWPLVSPWLTGTKGGGSVAGRLECNSLASGPDTVSLLFWVLPGALQLREPVDGGKCGERRASLQCEHA